MTAPKHDDARLAAGIEEAQSKENTDILTASDEARKFAATLQARAALAGIALHKIESGGWLACRWGLTRELRNDDEAAAWLARVGGQR